jgi:ATP-dependent Clp protease protease subunit
LDIFINSEGGDVFEAKAIYAQLKRFGADAEVIVHIDGIAASAATFVAMAGDKIITAPEATWMVHEAWTLAMGNAGDLRDTADLLDMMNEDIAAIYAKRTGRSVEEMRAMMSVETWMNAQEAKDAKFTDEIASYDDGEDEEDVVEAKSTLKVAAVAETTNQRLSAMTADLLAFRAKRVQDASPTTNNSINTRASAVPQKAKPASR